MLKNFQLSGALSSFIRKNDIFLLVLLMVSLSLNVYLGWKVKGPRRTSAALQNSATLSLGTTVQPITATSLSGKQETISYADHGKPTVVYVFTPTCVWCERNTQNINAIAGLKGESFRII